MVPSLEQAVERHERKGNIVSPQPRLPSFALAFLATRLDAKAYAPWVTLVWFAVWLIWNNVGDKEPLTFAPVNWWTGLLLLAVALDLGGGHAHGARR